MGVLTHEEFLGKKKKEEIGPVIQPVQESIKEKAEKKILVFPAMLGQVGSVTIADGSIIKVRNGIVEEPEKYNVQALLAAGFIERVQVDSGSYKGEWIFFHTDRTPEGNGPTADVSLEDGRILNMLQGIVKVYDSRDAEELRKKGYLLHSEKGI